MESQTFSMLVLDANQRSALAVTRSLGRSGQFLVTTADSTATALAGQSRFSQQYLQYPCPITEPVRMVQWLKEHTSRHRYDLVLPTTEVTSQLLLLHQAELPELQLAFPSFSTVMQLADKIELVKLARRLEVPAPESQIYENAREVKLEDIAFPVVLKPARSQIYTGSGWIQTHVRVLQKPEDWHQYLKQDTYLHDSPFMLQSFVPGHGAGVFCLFNHGIPVQFFAHERLREKPPEGGVSVLSRSVPVNDTLRGYAERLLGNVGWHGVAMVEFRVGPDGQAYLMEVNTRFWGSLQLAIDSGVDFPKLLVERQLGLSGEAIGEYKLDQRLRWLLGDLDSLYIFLKRSNSLRAKLKRIIDFLSISFGNQRHEINRMTDLKPAWYELKQYLKALRG